MSCILLFVSFNICMYIFQSPRVKAQGQRPVRPFMDKNNRKIMTPVLLLVLFMFSEKDSAHASQGKCTMTSLCARFCFKLWTKFRFAVTYNFCLPECGSVVKNTLTSPGYPNNYPNNLDCNYSVPIPSNMAMKISLHDFALEYHETCE